MNKETLEQAAHRILTEYGIKSIGQSIGVIKVQELMVEMAKYQAERMYSEEDMIRFAEFVATHPDKNKNVHGQMLHAKSKYDGAERTIDLLEQFKKK